MMLSLILGRDGYVFASCIRFICAIEIGLLILFLFFSSTFLTYVFSDLHYIQNIILFVHKITESLD